MFDTTISYAFIYSFGAMSLFFTLVGIITILTLGRQGQLSESEPKFIFGQYPIQGATLFTKETQLFNQATTVLSLPFAPATEEQSSKPVWSLEVHKGASKIVSFCIKPAGPVPHPEEIRRLIQRVQAAT